MYIAASTRKQREVGEKHENKTRPGKPDNHKLPNHSLMMMMMMIRTTRKEHSYGEVRAGRCRAGQGGRHMTTDEGGARIKQPYRVILKGIKETGRM